MVDSASEKGSRRSSSDLSVWSDTGDIAEQIADEDPLQTHPRRSLDRERVGRRDQNQTKRVHYLREVDDDNYICHSQNYNFGINPEKIPIPNPKPRRISLVEQILAVTMSPRNGRAARVHGLVGQPLL